MLGFSALSEAPLSTLPAAAGGGTDVTVTPGAGSLTLTGFAPTVTATSNATVTPGAGSLTLTGLAPTVSATQSQTVTPGTGALVITGYAPTVTVPTSVTVEPGTGGLTITGYAPTVDNGEASGSKGGGVDPYYYKKRKKAKQPEPVSKTFGDTWKPPVPRPVIPQLPPAQEIIARQEAAISQTQVQLARALEQLARQQAEAEQEDEDDVALLLLVA